MNVPSWLWFATIGGLVAVIVADLLVVGRVPHAVTLRETTRWVLCYVGLAVLFGLGVWLLAGGRAGGEFFAGYVTEYSLSLDNLFVFAVIMSSLAVPAANQHRVLLFGIVIALVLRGAFIAVGAAAVARFTWVFFLFAAVLLYTAVNLIRQGLGDDEEWREGRFLRLVRRVLPVTPMMLVMLAIGTTDLLFALDSIPAIFGLTREPYLVFTANAFALMGLRQLYFLLGGLLRRLVYLSYGLAVILAFIGVKMVLHALHENSLPFLNGGRPVPVPEVGIGLSLGVITGVLAVTTVASLLAARRAGARVTSGG
ncbi:TerC family protein [Amycolatopsis anabasis]|uniref:TerC family protein n=1 Tax=Amycolatopsis anabasis TaxID=1840409 RepID=UPI00131D1EF7|nr:TerC family protein [Amycolatopsis anabasis]